MVIWHLNKLNCLEVVLRSILVTIKLILDEKGTFWLTWVCRHNNYNLIKNFWMELHDLFCVTFSKWCVGGRENLKKIGQYQFNP